MSSRINEDGLALNSTIGLWKMVLSSGIGLMIILGMVFYFYQHDFEPSYNISIQAPGIEWVYKLLANVLTGIAILYIILNLFTFINN